jgi:SAM-dependent methyltransferase
MNKVEKYYTEDYCEQNRLGEGCDNRHKVEIINKSFLLENEICKHAFSTCRVLDLGAGTGFWTDFIIKKLPFTQIVCGDIVPKHNEILKERFANNHNVTVMPLDALNLPVDILGKFDIILCGGPFYHCNFSYSKKIVKELEKVSNGNTLVFVDWLSEASGVVNWSLMTGKPIENIDLVDNMFHYKSTYVINELFKNYGLVQGHYAIDGITRFIADEVNKYDEDQLQTYCVNVRKFWHTTADLSEHSITVLLM